MAQPRGKSLSKSREAAKQNEKKNLRSRTGYDESQARIDELINGRDSQYARMSFAVPRPLREPSTKHRYFFSDPEMSTVIEDLRKARDGALAGGKDQQEEDDDDEKATRELTRKKVTLKLEGPENSSKNAPDSRASSKNASDGRPSRVSRAVFMTGEEVWYDDYGPKNIFLPRKFQEIVEV